MLRFKPDDPIEALLRPFLMVDPVAGIYFEDMVPDLRFAFLVLVLATVSVGWLWRSASKSNTSAPGLEASKPRLHSGQLRALFGVWVMFFAWTLVIGNGRYFLAGLLLVGPILALACRMLPGSPSLRWTALASVAILQTFAVTLAYEPNTWGLARWKSGSGLPIEASPLRQAPAVFLTVSGISYSLIVPLFHPQSRWSNISGQRDLTPDAAEYPRLQALLDTSLPKYVVAAVNSEQSTSDGQPNSHIRTVLNVSLAPHHFSLAAEDCITLRSSLAAGMEDEQGKESPTRGFWFCPFVAGSDRTLEEVAKQPRWDEVFAQLEARCPRFFPPNDSKLRQFSGVAVRHYTSSDTQVYVDGSGQVQYKYFRAMNPTLVGTTDQVLRGEFELNCQKLPGRYVPPWQRD